MTFTAQVMRVYGIGGSTTGKKRDNSGYNNRFVR